MALEAADPAFLKRVLSPFQCQRQRPNMAEHPTPNTLNRPIWSKVWTIKLQLSDHFSLQTNASENARVQFVRSNLFPMWVWLQYDQYVTITNQLARFESELQILSTSGTGITSNETLYILIYSNYFFPWKPYSRSPLPQVFNKMALGCSRH